jgi:hypothetical protein
VGREFLDAVGRKHARVGTASGRLLGDGLRPVLTELGRVAVPLRIRPGATWAVETVLLVQLGEGLVCTTHSHLGEGEAHRVDHRRHTRRVVLRPGYALGKVVTVVVLLGHCSPFTGLASQRSAYPRGIRDERASSPTP